ncbi:MAG: META domain-containing protein, partial [Geminicoccaceae bacterium]
YGGASDSSGDIGRWHADPERGAIVLRGGREAPVFLEILANGDLRLMGLDGTPIDSDLPYTLAAGPLEPGAAPLFLTGMVQRGAEGASFTECLTGRTYPIAKQGDYPAAMRALADLGRDSSQNGGDPDSPVFAVLEGRLAPHPDSEGPDRTHLVIDRFDRVELFLTCDRVRSQAGPPPPGPALTNTYWKITVVLGDEVTPTQTRREPHLILRTGTPPAFEATLGCAHIRGHHSVEGATLSFSEGATMVVACPRGLARQEQRLAKALEQVVRWDIDGTALVLLNGAGDPVLTGRAVYLR